MAVFGKGYTAIIFSAVLISGLVGILFTGGCSSRSDLSQVESDSTINFPGKDTNAVSATITLYRYEDEITGKKIGKGTRFYLNEDAFVRASIDINGLKTNKKHPEMFHIDWIDPEQQSFYMKREEFSSENPVESLYSSISVSPDRNPGRYAINVYYFRELIARKYFDLIPDSLQQPGPVEGITASVTLCTKVGRKSGERLGIDSVFVIGEKSYVRAFVDLENRFANGDLTLDFDVEWIGPDKQTFYRKEIELLPHDSTTFLYSSISIPGDKREPGPYQVKVRLFGLLLAEYQFMLVIE